MAELLLFLITLMLVCLITVLTLLTKYGYRLPPQTWSELEKMAFRIQEGERAAGDQNFWGLVWPGAADECLTCLALEWQASEGGGRIIESNRTISVIMKMRYGHGTCRALDW